MSSDPNETPNGSPPEPEHAAPPRTSEGEGGPGITETTEAGFVDDGAEAGLGAGVGAPAAGEQFSAAGLDVEALVVSLEQVTAERDEWQATSQRIQAEFVNYKKRSGKDAELAIDQKTGKLAESLLPVLDACDGAIAHGSEDVGPILSAMLDALAPHGLERVDPESGVAPFDPELHDAVMHEEAPEGGPGHPVVAEVMRAGYQWQGRCLRPAMVRVQG